MQLCIFLVICVINEIVIWCSLRESVNREGDMV